MTGIWIYWSWPIALSAAWLDLWLDALAVVPPHPAHPAPVVDDEPPCTDHELFA